MKKSDVRKMLLSMAAIALSVCAIVLLIQPATAHAREGTLTFSWDPDADYNGRTGITELRVYQDSSENTPFVADPNAGTITVRTNIDGCSNFWATYATETEESDRTDPPIKACEPQLGDPEPATQIISVGGFKLTIDFEPLPKD